MKYTLINKATKEEHICDKVSIGAFDYYVCGEKPSNNDCVITPHDYIKKIKSIHEKGELLKFEDGSVCAINHCKFIIATNDPFTEIPQIIDDVEKLAEKVYTPKNTSYKVRRSSFKTGYNKSQETHPFSEEDMIAFNEWCSENFDRSYPKGITEKVSYPKTTFDGGFKKEYHTTKELLSIWREKQTKIIYYAHSTI